MALHLNLLHEEIQEQRQRQRDPLKLGLIALGAIGALFFLYYMWQGYRVLQVKNQLSVAEAEWAKVEPKVTSAQKRATDLSGTINTTRILDDKIHARVYWGPILERIARCVAPNTQIVSLDGMVDAKNAVAISLEGVAAGAEPRSVAEDLRQMLFEQLGKHYPDVSVEFKSLEDLDTQVSIGGSNVPTARYFLKISFQAGTPATADAAAAPRLEKAP